MLLLNLTVILICVVLVAKYIKRRPESFLAKNWQKLILGIGVVMTIASTISVVSWNISYNRKWPDTNQQPFEPAAVLIALFFYTSLLILFIGVFTFALKWWRSKLKRR